MVSVRPPSRGRQIDVWRIANAQATGRSDGGSRSTTVLTSAQSNCKPTICTTCTCATRKAPTQIYEILSSLWRYSASCRNVENYAQTSHTYSATHRCIPSTRTFVFFTPSRVESGECPSTMGSLYFHLWVAGQRSSLFALPIISSISS